MTATTHLQRYPKARASTILHKQKVEEKTAQLRMEIEAAKKRRESLITKWQRTKLWPSWIWKW